MSVDLNTPGIAKALSAQIKADIDAYCEAHYFDPYRAHLGASVIGAECMRAIWYSFRWCTASVHTGRMYRLFNRGHLEEARFAQWLNGIGIALSDTAEDGSQHRVSAVAGHFGGSLDGMCKLAERYDIAQSVLLTEFKTSNTKGFVKLSTNGVKMAKPQHYAQMCVYGAERGLEFALYMCVCKETDEIYVEVVKLDWAYGNELIGRGKAIIMSQVPPNRISASEAYYGCKGCDHVATCHRGAPAAVNCRSCVNAAPGDEKSWCCKLYGVIPDDVIKVGCATHSPIA